MVADYERGHGGPIALIDIGNLDVPADRAVFGIQRDHVRIGTHEIKPVAVDGDTALPDVVPFVGRVLIVPDQMPGAGIDGPQVIGDGEVKDSVNQQGCGFDARRLIGLKGPGQTKPADICGGNLRKVAVAAPE